jgi:hypothetical protein
MSESQRWRGIPLDKRKTWSNIFGQSREGINLSASCPVCGAYTLHRYYLKGRPLNRYIDGELFVADGASWEWCSTCHSYEHSHALVPEWWHESLDLGSYQLTAEPEALEQALTHKE